MVEMESGGKYLYRVKAYVGHGEPSAKVVVLNVDSEVMIKGLAEIEKFQDFLVRTFDFEYAFIYSIIRLNRI